jgi:hypothetical protein
MKTKNTCTLQKWRLLKKRPALERCHHWGPNAAPLFPVLIAVDDAAGSEIGAADVPTPTSASAAALVGYKILFGELPPVRDHDWPDGFALTDEAESELAAFGLRVGGFDPIVFDGTDPAAYVWALFEIGERRMACDAVARPHDHRACPPRGLAVVSKSVRPKAPAPVPLQPAGVGGKDACGCALSRRYHRPPVHSSRRWSA